jgi:hypothetical protein
VPAHIYKEKILVGLLLLAYVILRYFYLDAVPRWDAATYWGGIVDAIESTKSIGNISELPHIILEKYNVFGHSAMGYVGLLVLGQLIDYPNLFILNFTNLLLATLSVFCVYKIFRWFLPQPKHLLEVLIATAIFAIDPLFFASSIFINTDFPVLVFLTGALAALLYGRYGLFAISSLFLIFSKATGLIFWVAMLGGLGIYGLIVLFHAIKIKHIPALYMLLPPENSPPLAKPPSLLLCTYRITCILLPGIAFKLYSVAQQGAMWSMNSGISFNSQGWNCFGFNPRVMSNRAAEIFILNFHWILVAIAVTGCLIGYGRLIERKKISFSAIDNSNNELICAHRKNEPHILLERWWGFLPIAMSFLAFIAFNLSYITYIIPRYVVYGGFFLIFFALIALQLAADSRKLRTIILSASYLLIFAQTFRTLDPLSTLYFGSAPFSQHKILQIDSAGEAQGNGFVYNAEFTLEDKLLNRMQKAIPIKPDTVIVTWNRDSGYSWFTRGDTFVDAKTLERTIDTRNSFRYNIIDVSDLHSAIAPPEAFYIYMPWLAQFSNEAQELAHISQFYQISVAEYVGFQGYSLRLYRLKRIAH